MRRRSEILAELAIAIAIIMVMVFAMYSCSEFRRREFRAECERKGGRLIEALAPDGQVALVCQSADSNGGVISIPDSRRIFMPRHQ